MRLSTIKLQRVTFIPDVIESGTLYVSEQYATAIHRCCCGCGQEVVTPLAPHRWQIRIRAGAATLTPSIGNWNLPCRSHYWIRAGAVVWAGLMSDAEIRRVQLRDRQDAERYIARRNGTADPHSTRPDSLAPAPNDELLIVRIWQEIRARFRMMR